MANKENLTIRIEPELKAEASSLFKELGMDLSTAIGIFFRQAIRCNGLPFEVKLDKNERRFRTDDSMVINTPNGPMTIFTDLGTLMPDEIADLGREYTEEELAAMSEEERQNLGITIDENGNVYNPGGIDLSKFFE